MCENQREVGNTIRVWVVVVPTGKEPSCGRPYGERAKLWLSLWGESQFSIVATGREPSFSRPYEERAKFSLRKDRNVDGYECCDGKA
uniref:Uncharacterized protein n=1 Tax=Tanacetum cinerariifolium TaxID=118510 RepID=A0A6L2MVN3_TANCI|nr:hypothetical protein [Tanacetum cinerariifolium]